MLAFGMELHLAVPAQACDNLGTTCGGLGLSFPVGVDMSVRATSLRRCAAACC